MPLHHSYQMHPTTHHLQQVSLQSHSANQGYNSPLNHHHVQPISQTPQQSHTQQYPLEVRFDDLGDDREHVVGNDNEFSEKRLVTPIPPLHIQQQIVNSSSTDSNTSPLIKSETGNTVAAPTTASTNTEAADQMLRSFCSRCKKEFDQPIIIPQSNEKVSGQTKFLAEPKIFKLCQHCRDLQRQRSRRWQKKTKDKQGTCRRCGSDIPLNEQKFVLCPSCRQNLRTRKANRAAQGKCVHCSGPLDASIITGEDKKLAANGKGKERSKAGSYKVCQRCRENDKIRRTNLEKMGNCNRCAKVLDASDIGKHKVCANCRNRKKKLTQNLGGVGNSDLDIRLSVSNGGSDHNSSMMGSLPNSNLVPQQMGMMASDQQAAIAMLSAGASAVSQYPPISMTQHLAPQQYSQAQYNQAVAQQQAFNQAIVQAQVQQQQAQAMNINTQQSPKQYAPVQQTRNTLDEFQNSYPTVNPHQ
ncbi:uncharacterized protein RJT20DRAFT_124085 [Scheffersomyces xylosifermentans]|uniref:uncharacterized protein n=1 Tax=Scheffersomyces xylosifermentans TaxID=1304137 RepID=UPI00315C7941